MYSTLLLECKDAIATITLNRPDKRNAISHAMIADIQSALDAIEKNHATRVVIITGAGKAFCAGMDLDKLAALATQSAAENQEDSRRIAKLLRRIWAFPRPTIAAVNGAAYAGGCGIATLCDFTLAVPEAKFGYTEVKIGFLPAIVSVFLTRQIGEKRSRDLLLTGRIIDATGSPRIRPRHRSRSRRPAHVARPRTRRRPHRRQPQQPHPRETPAHLRAAAGIDHDLERAIMENARIRCTADFKEGVASFLEKRKPVWQSKPED